MIEVFRPLTSFLTSLEIHGLLNRGTIRRQVIYADDQFVNQELIKMNISEIDIQNELKIFSDGLQTIIAIRELLNDFYKLIKNAGASGVYQPIQLLIIDINMPFDGL